MLCAKDGTELLVPREVPVAFALSEPSCTAEVEAPAGLTPMSDEPPPELAVIVTVTSFLSVTVTVDCWQIPAVTAAR